VKPPHAPSAAAQRLAQSRAHLAQWLVPDDPGQLADPSPPLPGPSWREYGPAAEPMPHAAEPGALWRELAGGVLSRWWRHQPLRATGLAAGALARSTVLPWARRHPWAALTVSAGVGAAVASVRPWRWARAPAVLVAGVLTQVAVQMGTQWLRHRSQDWLQAQRSELPPER